MDQIGKGGFGNVYKARHKNWGIVAYKELEAEDGRYAYIYFMEWDGYIMME